MNILTIPLRNTRRKWLRTLMLLSVFTLGVVSIVSLNYVSRVVGENLEYKLTSFGANILIVPKRETLTVSYGGFSMGDMTYDVQHIDYHKAQQQIEAIELRERLSVIAPKLVMMTKLQNRSVGVVGVNWNQEINLKGYWAVDGSFPAKPTDILAGSAIARELGITKGSTLSIHGQPVTVSGVLYETGSDDDSVLLTDLNLLQSVYNLPGKVSFVEVAAICAGCPIEDITTQLASALPTTDVRALQNIVKQRMYSVHFVQRLVLTVSLIILLTACAMVAVSMLNAVTERKKEIGLLRSIGFSRPSIFTIFCAEALGIGIMAGLLGYFGGLFASQKALAVLDMTEGATVSFDPVHLLATIGAVALVSTTSALFPAWKASRIAPSEALIAL